MTGRGRPFHTGWLLLLTLASLIGLGGAYWPFDPPYPDQRERFGVGLAGPAGSVLAYDLQALGVGWYLNWGAASDPPHPNGAAFAQTLRINRGMPTLNEAQVRALARANPGALWLIGNEPDCVWMDNTRPADYAQAYHTLYHWIKSEDPWARVGFGGVVQATPLRMLYLERVWQAYLSRYGEPMPVDVWAVHGFILREASTGWGAGIPPGLESYAYLGSRYDIRDHDNMGYFVEQIVRFRQWMADHGQRERPLLVPEYGILMWSDILDEDGQDFSDDRVIAFMYATFDFFRTAADPNLGYPADDNHLVQAWAWYSLDDNRYQGGQVIGEGYNGDLFAGATTKSLTALGRAYRDYVQSLPSVPAYTDLVPLRFGADLTGAVWNQTATITLTAEVANLGRLPAQEVTVRFWDGAPGNGTPIGSPSTLSQIPGRYEGIGTASVTWLTPVSGTHTIWLDVDSNDQIPESNEGNNHRSLTVSLEGDLLPGSLRLLPLTPLLEGEEVTVTASAVVTNVGAVAIPPGSEVWFWVGEPDQGLPAARIPLGGLGAGRAITVEAALHFSAAGLYPIAVQADGNDVLVESEEGNNRLLGWLLVALKRNWLPAVFRQ